jgi:hypothetical protein
LLPLGSREGDSSGGKQNNNREHTSTRMPAAPVA